MLTAEQLEKRRTKIGASDAPILMGVSPWKTPYQLWLEKITGKTGQMTKAMTFGVINESVARERFEQMTGLVMFPKEVTSVSRNWQMATLDGIDMEEENIVEIKCSNRHDHDLAKDGKVPDKYYPQLQHQLAVTNLERGFYFSYHQNEGIIVEVKRNDTYLSDLLKVEEQFYFDHLLTGEPPELCDRDYVEKKDEHWEHFSYMYILNKKEIDHLLEENENIKKELIRLCGDSNGQGNGVKVTRSFPKGTINYKNIPELKNVDLETYRNPRTERWTINLKKEKSNDNV